MKRDSIRLVPALALAACGHTALADWQCLSAGATVPAAAQAASDYLGRAERVYPAQLLGVLRSGGRVYLVNARDDGWSERVRLALMELRLAEPDITAARRFQSAVGGTVAQDVPPGEFACLERERAGRHGFALTAGGAVLLAAGESVHLVDPAEPAIAVEVKATGGQVLDLREIFAGGGRAGIYAGLAASRARPGVAVALKVGPPERPSGEIVVTPQAVESGKEEETAAIPGANDAPSGQAPAVVPPAPIPPVAAESPARVVKADVPVAPLPVEPLPQEAPAAVVVKGAEPMSIVAPGGAPAAQGTRPAAGQSYEEYAKTMKALMALRRSGSVSSISEMTYVHPAVEGLRGRR
jgi:hypothetical protein